MERLIEESHALCQSSATSSNFFQNHTNTSDRLTIGLPLSVQIYSVPFASYLTLNNIVTLKYGSLHRSLKVDKQFCCRREDRQCFVSFNFNNAVYREQSPTTSALALQLFCHLRRNVDASCQKKQFIVRLPPSTNSAAYCYQRRDQCHHHQLATVQGPGVDHLNQDHI